MLHKSSLIVGNLKDFTPGMDPIVRVRYQQVRGRERRIFLTEQGQEIIKEVSKAWNALFVRYTAVRGEELTSELTRNLRKALDVIHEVSP